MLPQVMLNVFNFSDYLRIGQAAVLIGVHPDSLRRWERIGKLKAYRHPINRYRLYLRDDLEAFLKEVETK